MDSVDLTLGALQWAIDSATITSACFYGAAPAVASMLAQLDRRPTFPPQQIHVPESDWPVVVAQAATNNVSSWMSCTCFQLIPYCTPNCLRMASSWRWYRGSKTSLGWGSHNLPAASRHWRAPQHDSWSRPQFARLPRPPCTEALLSWWTCMLLYRRWLLGSPHGRHQKRPFREHHQECTHPPKRVRRDLYWECSAPRKSSHPAVPFTRRSGLEGAKNRQSRYLPTTRSLFRRGQPHCCCFLRWDTGSMSFEKDGKKMSDAREFVCFRLYYFLNRNHRPRWIASHDPLRLFTPFHILFGLMMI